MNPKGLLLIIGLLIAGYFLYGQTSDFAKPKGYHQATPSSTPSAETVNWKTYTDTSNKYSFTYSFKYPQDYIPYYKDANVLHSSDAQFDKVTTAKTSGIEIGSYVTSPKEDKQDYIGESTKIDSNLTSQMVLPQGAVAKAYVNYEDIQVVIDYKKDNQDIRIMIWCGGENGNPDSCKKVLTLLLPTFKITDQNQANNSIWKTYTNTKYGYSIKYPAGLFVKESAGTAFSYEPFPTEDVPIVSPFGINIKGDYVSKEFDALLQAKQGDDVPEAHHAVDVKVNKIKNLKFGDYNAVEFIRDGTVQTAGGPGRGPIGYEHKILIKKTNQEFIELINTSASANKTNQQDYVFNQMTSTFTFTN